ncbi:MAG: hypothetical protein J5778_02105 [Clostridiales bacterium]|nr:hypothetical protein [Clostridiales bacterium]
MNYFSALRRKATVCLLAIVMVAGIFQGTLVNAAAPETLDAAIRFSYDFQEDFDMIFSCKIYSSGNFSNVRLNVDFGGKTTEIKQADFSDPATGVYRFTFRGVSAAEMTTVAKATLLATSGSTTYQSSAVETSVKSYAMGLLDYYSNLTGDKTKTYRTALCKAIVDMLNYGAAAQVYFGKNTNDLANKSLTSAQKQLGSSLAITPATCYAKKDLAQASASIEKIALSFENPVDFILYAKFANKPSDSVKAEISYKEDSGSTKTLSVASSAFELQEAEGLYRIEFKDIPSRYLKSALSIVLKDGNTAISSTVTYSCESYVKAILDGNFDNNVKDLVKKMLVYGDSAKAYAATLHTGCVTYRQFGAMGNGKADDYYAIVMTHDYANAKNLPVKADIGAHYYVKYMDPRSYKGAQIKTDTEWGNDTWGDAKFTIDDEKLGNTSISKPKDNMQLNTTTTITEGHCFLFTVEPSKPSEYKYSNSARKIYLGVDANLSNYPNYDSQDDAMARTFKNKTFSKNTTKFEGNFTEDALYYIRTDSVKRFGRNHMGGTNGKDQQEVIIVNKTKSGSNYGMLDSSTPLCWDWEKMYIIVKYPMDKETIQVKGGDFTTIVNTDRQESYIHRGISVCRSNVVLKDIKHDLAGEEKQFVDGLSWDEKKNVYKAHTGAPYHGFIRVDHCAHVTIDGCTFTDHLRNYQLINDDQSHSTAPYDFYAEYAVDVTLKNCKCNPTKVAKYNLSDPTGIMDETTRWGTMGTNYMKDFKVIGCKLSRVDAHQGVYNLTVKDSELGIHGIATVGFGKLHVENTLNHATYFISLRRDFGSAWFGDVEVVDCTWDIRDQTSRGFFEVYYDPTFQYCYEPFEYNGRTYYSSLPKTVTINGLTIDGTGLYNDNGYGFHNRGFNVFDQVIYGVGTVDEDYLSRKNAPSYEVYTSTQNAVELYKRPYYFPLKAPDKVTVSGIKVINPDVPKVRNSKLAGVFVRRPGYAQIHDSYFFTKDYDATTLVWDQKVEYEVRPSRVE